MAVTISPLRLRLKADGRIVQVTPDGREMPIPAAVENPPSRLTARLAALSPVRAAPIDARDDATYARGIRARTRLTQAEFAARIGVPIETVRNWEQGKRSPRGPARALLKVIDNAPDLVFAALAKPETKAR